MEVTGETPASHGTQFVYHNFSQSTVLNEGNSDENTFFSGLSFEPWIYHHIMRNSNHYTATVVG